MAQLEIIRPRQLTRWQKLSQSLRSFSLGPFNLKDPELVRAFGGRQVSSGVSVTETTAMNYSAVWSAVSLISGHIASVPLVLYKREVTGGKSRFETHPLYRIIHDRPNPHMGSQVFRRTLQAHKLIWGNGYAEIERDEAGRPKNLWPLLPFLMQPFYDHGVLKYRYTNQGGTQIVFDPADILHVRGLGDTGIEGYSVVSKARESLGLGMAAEQFGGTFFGNGATFGGVIRYPAGVNPTPQTRKENREALEKQHAGVERAHRFLALYEGAEYERLGIPPNDAQFLETRMFQIEEVARWFNIPPHKLKHLERTSYNSIEHQGIEYVTDTLDPDWVTWEQELNMKLVSPLERGSQLIEHVREGMLRGDSVSRSSLQSTQFSIASITPNEVREQENRNPIANGEKAFVALNLIPLDMVEEYWRAQIDNAKQPKVMPQAPAAKDLDEEVKAARARAQAAEDAKDIAVENARRADERAELIAVAHAQDREHYAQDVAQLGDALAVANTSLHDAASREQALSEQCDTLETDKRRFADDFASTERLRVAVVAERDAAQLAADQARASSSAERASVTAVLEAAFNERDAAKALADEAAKERDAAKAQAEERGELAEIAKAGYDNMLKMYDKKELERAATQAERDMLTAEAESIRTDLARARADLATELDAKPKQKAVTLAAMRSLFVDASERLLQKESDRARKHQATGEKLRAWVEGFYPMHVETVRAAFRPLVGAWVAVTGGESGVLLERLVSEHTDASKQAFAHVLDAEDDDLRASALERMLRRWETERADAMADALVREGMAGNG